MRLASESVAERAASTYYNSAPTPTLLVVRTTRAPRRMAMQPAGDGMLLKNPMKHRVDKRQVRRRLSPIPRQNSGFLAGFLWQCPPTHKTKKRRILAGAASEVSSGDWGRSPPSPYWAESARSNRDKGLRTVVSHRRVISGLYASVGNGFGEGVFAVQRRGDCLRGKLFFKAAICVSRVPRRKAVSRFRLHWAHKPVGDRILLWISHWSLPPP